MYSTNTTADLQDYKNLIHFIGQIEIWNRKTVEDLILTNKILGMTSEDRALTVYESIRLFIEFQLGSRLGVNIENRRYLYHHEITALIKTTLDTIYSHHFDFLCEKLKIERSKEFVQANKREFNSEINIVQVEFSRKIVEIIRTNDLLQGKLELNKLEEELLSIRDMQIDVSGVDENNDDFLHQHSMLGATDKPQDTQSFSSKIYNVLLDNVEFTLRDFVLPLKNDNKASTSNLGINKKLERKLITDINSDILTLVRYLNNITLVLTRNSCIDKNPLILLEYYIPNFIYLTHKTFEFYVDSYQMQSKYNGYLDLREAFSLFGSNIVSLILEDIHNLHIDKAWIEESEAQILQTTNATDLLDISKKTLAKALDLPYKFLESSDCLSQNRFNEQSYGFFVNFDSISVQKSEASDRITTIPSDIREEVLFNNDIASTTNGNTYEAIEKNTFDKSIIDYTPSFHTTEAFIEESPSKLDNGIDKYFVSYKIFSFLYEALEGACEIAESIIILRQFSDDLTPLKENLAFKAIYEIYIHALKKEKYILLDDTIYLEEEVKLLLQEHIDFILKIVFEKISTRFSSQLEPVNETTVAQDMFIGFSKETILKNLGMVYGFKERNYQTDNSTELSNIQDGPNIDKSNVIAIHFRNGKFNLSDFYDLMDRSIYIGADLKTCLSSIGYLHFLRGVEKASKSKIIDTLIKDAKATIALKLEMIDTKKTLNADNEESTTEKYYTDDEKRKIYETEFYKSFTRSNIYIIADFFSKNKQEDLLELYPHIANIIASLTLKDIGTKKTNTIESALEKFIEFFQPKQEVGMRISFYIRTIIGYINNKFIELKDSRNDFLKIIDFRLDNLHVSSLPDSSKILSNPSDVNFPIPYQSSITMNQNTETTNLPGYERISYTQNPAGVENEKIDDLSMLNHETTTDTSEYKELIINKEPVANEHLDYSLEEKTPTLYTLEKTTDSTTPFSEEFYTKKKLNSRGSERKNLQNEDSKITIPGSKELKENPYLNKAEIKDDGIPLNNHDTKISDTVDLPFYNSRSRQKRSVMDYLMKDTELQGQNISQFIQAANQVNFLNPHNGSAVGHNISHNRIF